MRDALRLFVAAYPPPDVAQSLMERFDSLNLRGVRPTPAHHVHLTLQFIGDTRPLELDQVLESVARSIAGLSSPRLNVRRLIPLPERGPPRLVAAEIEPHPTVQEIHRRLALRLAKNVREKQRDQFKPHMTLGRFSGAADNLPIPSHDLEVAATFTMQRVVVVRSVLHPDRAEHSFVQEFSLDEPG